MINSITIALTGLNSAAMRINESASNIANINTPLDKGEQRVDLAEEIVNMKIDEISYKANINTIKIASSMFDELLKITED